MTSVGGSKYLTKYLEYVLSLWYANSSVLGWMYLCQEICKIDDTEDRSLNTRGCPWTIHSETVNAREFSQRFTKIYAFIETVNCESGDGEVALKMR